MTTTAWIAVVSITVTILIVSITALINLAYKQGHMGARVQELERWRTDMRKDMHEISERLEYVGVELRSIHTLIDERTEKRMLSSKSIPPDHNPRRRGEDR